MERTLYSCRLYYAISSLLSGTVANSTIPSLQLLHLGFAFLPHIGQSLPLYGAIMVIISGLQPGQTVHGPSSSAYRPSERLKSFKSMKMVSGDSRSISVVGYRIAVVCEKKIKGAIEFRKGLLRLKGSGANHAALVRLLSCREGTISSLPRPYGKNNRPIDTTMP